jgi:predicted RNA-binding Zn ribbon-like protein
MVLASDFDAKEREIERLRERLEESEGARDVLLRQHNFLFDDRERIKARLEAAERDAAKWKQYHGELCTVEIELRTCIHALLETATPDEQTKATLYGFDLWPRCSVTKAIDAARGTT